jgi:5-methylthioadenosine/S-adenosylhomocysteine deaminase
VSAARLRARWILPVAAAPIAGGAMLIDDAGALAAVGPADTVPAPRGAASYDLGDVVLLPGLVNTHAHLELSALAGLAPNRAFRDWILRVRALKDALTPDELGASAAWGVLQSFAAGITTIGDTGSSGAAAAAMARLGARGVAYQEVFGPDPAQYEDALAGLESAVDHLLAAHASARVRIGVSPHAPYTVSAPLLTAVARLAGTRALPVAMHLAESLAEREFVQGGRGPLADALRARGIAVEPEGLTPVGWVRRAGLLETRPLLIHCVQCDQADIGMIAAAGARVAHCPHSNQELGHGRMSLAAILGAGIWVWLGTDSVATGAALDLFRVAGLARDSAQLEPADAVAMMTAMGARALGLTGIGYLAPGGRADLTAVDLRGHADPFEAVLAASPACVRGTWVAGRQVWDGAAWPAQDGAAVRAASEMAGARVRAALS